MEQKLQFRKKLKAQTNYLKSEKHPTQKEIKYFDDWKDFDENQEEIDNIQQEYKVIVMNEKAEYK